MDPVEMNNQQGDAPEAEKKSGVGAVVGTIIIILLLALGALYFWGARLNEKTDNPPPYILGSESEPQSDAAAGLPAQSASDKAADIYADLQAMDMDQLEFETVSSQQSFNSEIQ